jgi:hypothetical protein
VAGGALDHRGDLTGGGGQGLGGRRGADVTAVLDPLRGWQRRTAIAALQSLFRYAHTRGVIFANPTRRLPAEPIGSSMLPMTDTDVQAVTQVAVNSDLQVRGGVQRNSDIWSVRVSLYWTRLVRVPCMKREGSGCC